MSKVKIIRAESTYVNGRLYSVKVYYASGVVREYYAPGIPSQILNWVRRWSPEMPEQAFELADSFDPETDCLYPDCYIFGGCPSECDYKRFCPDYDGGSRNE